MGAGCSDPFAAVAVSDGLDLSGFDTYFRQALPVSADTVVCQHNERIFCPWYQLNAVVSQSLWVLVFLRGDGLSPQVHVLRGKLLFLVTCQQKKDTLTQSPARIDHT